MKILLAIMLVLATGCMIPNPTLHHYISSPLKGTVSESGTPVTGAIVSRKCSSDWYGEFPEEFSITDKAGHYEFPALKKFNPVIPLASSGITLTLKVKYEGKTFLGHECKRIDFSKYGELVGIANCFEEPYISIASTGEIYVYPPRKRQSENRFFRRRDCLELNFDLAELKEYPQQVAPIPVSSLDQAYELIGNFKK